MTANLLSAAMAIWEDAKLAGVCLDMKLRCTYMAVLLRAGNTKKVIKFYEVMVQRAEHVPQHALVLTMRALARLGEDRAALDIWINQCLGLPQHTVAGAEKSGKRQRGNHSVHEKPSCASSGSKHGPPMHHAVHSLCKRAFRRHQCSPYSERSLGQFSRLQG
jgi:hypothetical protein